MADKKVTVAIVGQNMLGAAVSGAQQDLKQLEASARLVTNALAAVGAGEIISKLGELAKGVLENAANFSLLSQKVGMTTEFLSELQYAAQLNNVEVDQMSVGLKKFNQAIEDAAAGSGKAATTFAALGINVRDSNGQIKSGETLLREVMQRFSETADGAGKTAAAVNLFGRAGNQLIPVLNLGSQGFQSLADEARRAGVVIDSETAEKAHRLEQGMIKLEARVKGAATEFMTGLMPALDAVGRALDATDGKTESLWTRLGNSSGKALGGFLLRMQADEAAFDAMTTLNKDKRQEYLSEVVHYMEQYRKLMDEYDNPSSAKDVAGKKTEPKKPQINLADVDAGTRALDGEVAALRRFASEYDALQNKTNSLLEKQNDPIQREIDQVRAQIQALRNFQSEHSDALLPGVNDQINALLRDQDALLQKRNDQLNEFMAKGANNNAALQAILGSPVTIPIAPGGTDFASQMDAIKNSQVYANEQMQKAWEDTRTSAERYGQQLELLNALHVKGLDDDTYQRSLRQLQQQYELTGFSLARLGQAGEKAFSQDLGRAIKDMVTGTKDAGKAMEEFALSFVADLMKMTLEMEVYYFWQKLTGLISGAFGAGAGAGGAGGSLGGAYSGGLDENIVPFYAGGGSMAAGQPGIVGDAGPELWVPDVSGRIIPNDKLGSAGGGRSPNVQLTVVNQGTPKSAQTSQPAWNDQMKQWHIQLHLDDATTNGPISRGMTGSMGGS